MSALFNKYYSQTVRKQLAIRWKQSLLPVYDGHIELQLALIIVSVAIKTSWLLVAIALAVILLLKILSKSYIQQINQNYQYLKDFPYKDLQQHLRNVLEYIKFKKMIAKGYELRTNTNIILHEEQLQHYTSQQSPQGLISQKDIQIQNHIVNIYRNLIQIYQNTQLISASQHSKIQQPIKYQTPLSFRSIFQINKKCLTFFDFFVNISFQFKMAQLDPYRTPCNSYSINKQIKILKQKLINLKNHIEQIAQQVNQSKQAQFQQQKYRHLLQFLTLKQAHNPQQISQIYSDLLLSVNEQPQENQVTSQRSTFAQQFQQSSASYVQQTVKENQVDPYLQQKKEFIKKLDILLSIGMIRRQQQLFNTKDLQKSAQIQNQSQSTYNIV